MDAYKKPRHGGNVPGLLSRHSISVRNSNMLATAAAVALFAALGAAAGHAVDGMAADLASGPVDALLEQNPGGTLVSRWMGGRVHGE